MQDEFQSCILLGVKPDSPPSEIKQRFRSLVQKWHPDKVQGDERRRREAEERIRAINRAYRSLMAARRKSWRAETAPEERPVPPGFEPIGWRQSAAESTAGGAKEDERTFYARALELHFRGMDEYSAGRYREAISSLMQSVCMVQRNPEAYRTLARSHRRLGQRAKAVSAYERAVQMEPDSVETRYELGESLAAVGDRASARRLAESLERLDPELAALLRSTIEGPSRNP
jgi:tetratricopeptide (TPR) repeat protein